MTQGHEQEIKLGAQDMKVDQDPSGSHAFEVRVYQSFRQALIQRIQSLRMLTHAQPEVFEDLPFVINFTIGSAVLPSISGDKFYHFSELNHQFYSVGLCVAKIKNEIRLMETGSSYGAENRNQTLEQALIFLHASGYNPDTLPTLLGEADFVALMKILQSSSVGSAQAAPPEKDQK